MLEKVEFERGYGVGGEEGREEGVREGKEEGMRKGRKRALRRLKGCFWGVSRMRWEGGKLGGGWLHWEDGGDGV